MSDIDTSHLHELISKFIDGKISGDTFEKSYTDIFDFEDIDEQEASMTFFLSIRQLLEHYSFSEKDLKEHPDYYIDESQLRRKIIELKVLSEKSDG